MTVSTVVNHEQYDGNGTTTVFPYRFRILKSSHMVVTVSNPDGVLSTLVPGTDYNVTGAGLVGGGNVELMTPLAAGWQISLDRDLPAVQETDLRNQGRFFAETHEDAFDYLTMLIQRVFSLFGLALRKPSWIAKYYDAQGHRIANLANPVNEQDAATKSYTDNINAASLNKTLRVPDVYVDALPSIENLEGKVIGFVNGKPTGIPAPSGSAADVLLELAKNTGAGLSGFSPSLTYPIGTVGSYLKSLTSFITPELPQYGGDIQSAANAAASLGLPLITGRKDYELQNALTLPSGLTWISGGTRIKMMRAGTGGTNPQDSGILPQNNTVSTYIWLTLQEQPRSALMYFLETGRRVRVLMALHSTSLS